jgi:cytochrome c-type biogenesis protein CcmH/NrfG
MLASRLLRRLLIVNPQQAPILHMLAIAALMQGDAQSCERLVERAVRIAGWLAAYLNSRGEARRQRAALPNAPSDMLASAATDFRQVIALDPVYVWAYANLAACATACEQHSVAAIAHRRAERLR